MKLILLNGAPRVGKDHAARFIQRALPDHYPFVVFDRMSMPIKLAFAAMIAADIDEYGDVDGYERDKEKVIPLLGVSYRQWQIDFSEKFMKPLYGNAIFAKLFLSRIEALAQEEPNAIVVVPDCGFQIEVDHVASEFPTEDIALFRLLRDHCTFDGDSRQYVAPAPKMFFRELYNDGTPAFETLILNTVQEFLNGAPQ